MVEVSITTKQELSPKILELRKKIHDKKFIDNAVYRIAHVLSEKLMEEKEYHNGKKEKT